MSAKPRCEALVCYGTRVIYNAVTVPKYLECPRDAEDGTHFCGEHQRPER